MLDISKMGVKPYEFTDGKKVIVTRNPSQKLYLYMAARGNSDMPDEEVFKLVDQVCNYMLHDEDKGVLDEVDISVKLALMEDYFNYHVGQLDAGFSNTSLTEA